MLQNWIFDLKLYVFELNIENINCSIIINKKIQNNLKTQKLLDV